jgi:anti-sigma-K factor RskA
MTDDRFDRELRSFLAAREPAAVSPVLRARLQAITVDAPARAGAPAGRLVGAWRAAVGLAAAAAVALALIAIFVRAELPVIRDPGQVGAPSRS